jgi:molecular chaperone GrpE
MQQEQSEDGATREPVAPRDVDAGEGSQAVDEDGLRTQVQELTERADSLLGNWQRAQADLTNYRRQMERDREEMTALSNAGLITDILPIMDDLERSLGSVANELRSYTWVDGIWLILKKLEAVLTSYGMERIEAKGQTLDPLIHQAVAEVDGEAGQVVDVVQRGFKLRQRLLRPVLVTVGRGPGGAEASSEAPLPETEDQAQGTSDTAS